MNIIQYQITHAGKDIELLDEFNEWLCEQMYMYLNTYINRKKIQLRINYLYKAKWIKWRTKYIDTEMIMQAIRESITYEKYKNNVVRINTDMNVLIPNTNTSIDRLIRFLNFGDEKINATGMVTALTNKFSYKYLNNLWGYFIHTYTGEFSTARLISE